MEFSSTEGLVEDGQGTQVKVELSSLLLLVKGRSSHLGQKGTPMQISLRLNKLDSKMLPRRPDIMQYLNAYF